MVKIFCPVRQARQKPTHGIDKVRFDQKYFKDQGQLVLDAYGAVRTLRLILASHPTVRAEPPKIGKHPYEGEIWGI